MNPVNPAAAIELSKGAVAIPDRATFDVLSLWGTAIIKFTILGAGHRQTECLLPEHQYVHQPF